MTTRALRRACVMALVVAVLAALQTATLASAASPDTTGASQQDNVVDGVDPELLRQFDSSAEVEFWVDLGPKADLDSASRTRGWARLGAAVTQELQTTARDSQDGIVRMLEDAQVQYQTFWISNAILVTGTKTLAERLAQHPEVASLRPTQTISIPEPTKAEAANQVQAIEWNIEQVRADDVWNTFGVRGEGIVVANVDTGVDFDHPALVRQYRGNLGTGSFDHNYNWYDPSNVCGEPSLEPCDNDNHGTHTMGTMVGDDGTSQVGVAPNATWIAAKGCETSLCSDAALLASAQWMLAPIDLNGENPRPDLRPHVINNSWGDIAHTPFFEDSVDAWITAGIFPVFSAGNEGPDCGTVGSPGDYDTAYSVGSSNRNGSISWFSSRGPGSNITAINPDIVAPGNNVRSSFNGGGYGSMSGTSMAAPHVAATVALMWSAAPSLQRDIGQTRQLLDQAAVDTEDLQCGGTAADNNVWGEGRLDTMEAVTSSPRGDTGTISGTVTDAETGSPLAGARVEFAADLTRTAWTRDDGTYSLELASGSYDLTATGYAYEPAVAEAVLISADSKTVQDFALKAAPHAVLSGAVVDSAGAPVPGTTVQILGTPIPDTTTDTDGLYQFPQVPEGEYDVRVTGSGCLNGLTRHVVLGGDTALDFALTRKVDGFGYHCKERPSSYLQPTEKLQIIGSSLAARVELPFPFTFYGETYTTANVTTVGFVNFGRNHPSFRNFPIPWGDWPNAAIFPFWEDLVVSSTSGIYTATSGVAPNRQVVFDWRNVTFWGGTGQLDFQVILHENGDIVTQYRHLDGDREHGGSATVGIENADGSVGYQYSLDEPALKDSVAIHFLRPPNGFATGIVRDNNDGEPIRGAEVTVLQDGTQVRQQLTEGDGSFKIEVPFGTYDVQITSPRYVTERRQVVIDEDDELVDVGATLETAQATVGTQLPTLVVPAGETRTRTLSISNTGSTDLDWQLRESDSTHLASSTTSTEQSGSPYRPAPGSDPQARTAESAFVGDRVPPGASTTAAGELVRSWRVADRPDLFGVGTMPSGDVWLGGNALEDSNTEYRVDGTPTGREWPTPWARTWAADMAYDSVRDQMCQVEIGGQGGIRCWNPATGDATGGIHGDFPWTETSQRGLAYRPDDDSFYIGGWNQGVLHHVAGLSSETPGQVLDSCIPADPAISGLGWNAATGTVWAATSSPDDVVYELDPESCSVLSTLAHPRPGFHGGGLEVDEVGNIWMVDIDKLVAHLYDGGVSALLDVPWLTAHASGALSPGESTEFDVSVDTAGLEPGVYDARVFVASSSGRDPYLDIPVRLVVPAYSTAFNSGGAAYTDGAGDTWQTDRGYDGEGTAGWSGRSGSSWKNKEILGTVDDALYRDQRRSMRAYSFDGLPDGVYEVDLRFSELIEGMKPGKRAFDVLIDDDVVLEGHDISAEAGALTADDHTFRVSVDDGHLEVSFEPDSRPPVIGAIRVSHRPDWE
ncbi:MAG: S8 family serine peptidase [Nocardioidaceae bacterium]